MVKHRRWSDEPKNESVDKLEESSPENFLPEKPSHDLKLIILSGTKYVYIIAAAALLSGIFTPFTVLDEWSTVIFGILTVLLGLGGGIAIFLGIKNQKFSTILVLVGLGTILACLVIMHEFVARPLFG